jgi:hypothetical protein
MGCAFVLTVVTARARCDHQLTGVVRTQRGPADLILIRVLRLSLFPQDRLSDLGERCTAGDRCEPLGSDGVWTKRGPGRAAQRSGRFGSLGTRASPGLHKDFEAWCEASAHSPLDGVIADLQHERECALAQQQARVGVRRSAPCSGDADAGRTRFTAAVSRMARWKTGRRATMAGTPSRLNLPTRVRSPRARGGL